MLAGIGAILLADVVNALIQVPAQALANAADADKNGFTAAGQNARFYYDVTKGSSGATLVTPPGCYVVAYAQLEPGAKPWCDNAEFKLGVPSTCAPMGRALLAELHSVESLDSRPLTSNQSLAKPDVYMEISLDGSGYPLVVRPSVVALYYPASLLSPTSSKPRTLSLALTPTSLVAGDALKGAAIALTITGVQPGPVIAADVLNVQSGWTSAPQIAVKPDESKPVVGTRYSPFNVSANLHEVGVPSLFLAAFAKSFGASVGDLGKAITPALLPSGQATAQQQGEANAADYDAKRASALKSYSDYLAACAKTPTSDSDKANAENLYWTVISNRRKANVAAEVANQPKPFDNPQAITKCF